MAPKATKYGFCYLNIWNITLQEICFKLFETSINGKFKRVLNRIQQTRLNGFGLHAHKLDRLQREFLAYSTLLWNNGVCKGFHLFRPMPYANPLSHPGKGTLGNTSIFNQGQYFVTGDVLLRDKYSCFKNVYFRVDVVLQMCQFLTTHFDTVYRFIIMMGNYNELLLLDQLWHFMKFHEKNTLSPDQFWIHMRNSEGPSPARKTPKSNVQKQENVSSCIYSEFPFIAFLL